MRHETVRQVDEYYCHRCNCRWGLDEDQPEHCVPFQPVDYELPNMPEPTTEDLLAASLRREKRLTDTLILIRRKTTENKMSRDIVTDIRNITCEVLDHD